MHILHVIDSLDAGGGAEESLVEMLPLLRSRGIEGSVACLYDRQGHEEALRSLGFSVEVLDGRNLLDSAAKIRRTLRATQPTLVHASLIDATFATRLARTGLKLPQLDSLVNTTYDPIRVRTTGVSAPKLNLIKLFDRFTSRSVTHFHALTEAVAAEARSALGIPANKITVIPRGRAPERVGANSPERRRRTREQLDIDLEAPVILNVGRRSPQKGKVYLLEALPRVVERFPNAILVIAGQPGSSDDEINDAISRLALEDHVRILGHRSDIGDLLNASDLFVLPSLFEGLGGSVIEAMAAGCPIITSDAPALVEVLADGQFGRITPRGDAPALAAAITGLLGDQPERDRLAAAARTQFDKVYNLETVVDRMAHMYRSVTSSFNGRDGN